MSQSLSCRNHRPILFAVSVLLSLLLPGSVLAESKKSDKVERETAARAACLDGNYTEGVGILTKLFVEFKNATYLFNQGRCFEQNRRYEEAISRFQEYLRVGRKSLDAEDKTEAEQHIKDCREMLAQERGTSPPPTVPQPIVASSLPTPPPPAANTKPDGETETVGTTAPPQQAESSGSGLRTAGLVLGGAGLVGVATGVVFTLKANTQTDQIESKTGGYTPDAVSKRQTYQNLSWVGYGAGAACLGVGIVLYALGARKADDAPSISLAPTVGPDHSGFAVYGVF